MLYREKGEGRRGRDTETERYRDRQRQRQTDRVREREIPKFRMGECFQITKKTKTKKIKI